MASPARAEPAPIGDDEVLLANGGSLRGTITAVEPGTHLVILEAGATAPRTIPWAEVADFERGKFAPGPPSPVAARPAKAPGKLVPGLVHVHIDSPVPVSLIEHGALKAHSTEETTIVGKGKAVLCDAPCDDRVDARFGRTFAVEGPGVPTSEVFTLSGRDSASLRVDPGSTMMQSIGRTFLMPGVGAMIAGSVFLAIGSADDAPDDFTGIGAVMLGTGAVLAGVGIALHVAGDTDVEVRTPAAALARPDRARRWLGGL